MMSNSLLKSYRPPPSDMHSEMQVYHICTHTSNCLGSMRSFRTLMATSCPRYNPWNTCSATYQHPYDRTRYHCSYSYSYSYSIAYLGRSPLPQHRLKLQLLAIDLPRVTQGWT